MPPSDDSPSSGASRSRRPGSRATRRERRRRTLAAAGVGLAVTLLLVAAKLLVEGTDFGRQLQLMTYNLLQLRLVSDRRPDVVVVDIRRLEPEGPPGRRFTPRQPLLELVAAIAEQRPRAIGLDIDMSPDGQGYIDGPADPAHFRTFLRIWTEQCVPVFVGVHRTSGEDPEVWLGNEEFAALAAAIVIPFDTRKMMQVLRRPASGDPDQPAHRADPSPGAQHAPAPDRCGTPVPDAGALTALDSLSHAAAKAFLAGTSPARWLDAPALHWLLEPYSQRRVSDAAPYWVGEFFVDYGSLAPIRERVLDAVDPAAIRASRGLLTDRVVLVGNASGAEDRFVVPGHQAEGALPGVFLHAAAVQTLIDGPLFELTPGGRILVDLAVSIGIIAAIAAIRLRYEDARAEVHTERLHTLLTGAAVAAVALAAFAVVTITRVMWDDALLVVGVLLLHGPAERAIERLHGLPPAMRRAWRRLVFRRTGEHP